MADELKFIMVRHAPDDDFIALRMAQGVENVGGRVMNIMQGADGRWRIWAKARDEAHVSEIDDAIDEALN